MEATDLAMVDLVFPLRGEVIPLDHGYLLFSAISTLLDTSGDRWFHSTAEVGLHLVRGQYAGRDSLRLDSRSVLGIRLPARLIPKCLPLIGKSIQLADSSIRVGIAITHALLPASAVYARIVTTRNGHDETRFDAEIQRQLDVLGIHSKVTRGKRRALTIKDKTIVGHSLLITELTAEESIRLQEHGLGGRRKMGCGLFMPWKG